MHQTNKQRISPLSEKLSNFEINFHRPVPLTFFRTKTIGCSWHHSFKSLINAIIIAPCNNPLFVQSQLIFIFLFFFYLFFFFFKWFWFMIYDRKWFMIINDLWGFWFIRSSLFSTPPSNKSLFHLIFTQ